MRDAGYAKRAKVIIQNNVIGSGIGMQAQVVNARGKLIEVKPSILEADPIARANYYLIGQSLQYLITGGQTLRYNGIEPIPCDGAVTQVTWTVGEGGASTVASINSEHSPVVPPYPARRRAENLRPTEQQKIENAANPARTNMFAPKPIGGA